MQQQQNPIKKKKKKRKKDENHLCMHTCEMKTKLQYKFIFQFKGINKPGGRAVRLTIKLS